MDLVDHENRSQGRYESLHSLISEQKGSKMDGIEKVNVNLGEAMGGGNAALMAALAGGGGGFGGNNGILPLVVLLAAMNGGRGGLFGGGGDQGVAGLNNIQSAIDTSAVLSGLSDLKASVPLSSCQTQQQVVASANDTNAQILQQTIAVLGQINDAKAAGVAAANQNALLLQGGFAQVKDATDSLSTQTAVGFGAINTNIERTGWNLAQTVTNDGEKTRALIQSIDKTNDSRLITAQANEIVELRAAQARAEDRHGIEISMTNNQNNNQLQFQAQAQVLNNLTNGLAAALQNIQATNQAINIGSGLMQANPTNTNTNVRA